MKVLYIVDSLPAFCLLFTRVHYKRELIPTKVHVTCFILTTMSSRAAYRLFQPLSVQALSVGGVTGKSAGNEGCRGVFLDACLIKLVRRCDGCWLNHSAKMEVRQTKLIVDHNWSALHMQLAKIVLRFCMRKWSDLLISCVYITLI